VYPNGAARIAPMNGRAVVEFVYFYTNGDSVVAQYLMQGSAWYVHPDAAFNPVKNLPAGNYAVNQDDRGNYCLAPAADFELPPRLYGDIQRLAERIIRTFMSLPGSTGVLLSGEKGSGKTLLSKAISLELAKLSMPTILVNQPWRGDSFNNLIQTIAQPAMVLFDEFEKIYDRKEQQSILTLLDGVFPTKKLFVLTCNEQHLIDANMRNRPGRLRYAINFSGLDESAIREYCAANLHNTAHIDQICSITDMFSSFNFDMLTALVSELNLYAESPSDALKLLNVSMSYDTSYHELIPTIIRGGKEYTGRKYLSPPALKLNPISDDIEIHLRDNDTRIDGDTLDEYYEFTSSDFVSYDKHAKLFVFQQDDVVLELRRHSRSPAIMLL